MVGRAVEGKTEFEVFPDPLADVPVAVVETTLFFVVTDWLAINEPVVLIIAVVDTMSSFVVAD